MRKGIIVALAILAFGLVQAQAADVEGDEARELTFSLCYARHAYGNCMSLGIGMRLDTRAKVEAKLGVVIDDDEGLKDVCWEGLSQSFEDQERWRKAEGREQGEREFCQQAWGDYGCSGAKVVGLLYHRDSFCKFE